ncbi:Transposon Ty3-G Gag-Pol polyprotein [Cucumis melo var. makuwa]|uniref:Transposon Ty3-G Gag-Pol polyprotein n=1 Tax=Cucumis melo var. makuwa TaxID=1194695 RepID=A0A5A7T8J0_CUCMM|nr:Transposon Ty3-G Gag-Pol polyprotein [Cucumis melo var. makuwa]
MPVWLEEASQRRLMAGPSHNFGGRLGFLKGPCRVKRLERPKSQRKVCPMTQNEARNNLYMITRPLEGEIVISMPSGEVFVVELMCQNCEVPGITPISQTPYRMTLSYYRHFVEGFSKIALPLMELTKKMTKFVWTKECEKSYQELKCRLTNVPILALPTSGKDIEVYCDASHQGLG